MIVGKWSSIKIHHISYRPHMQGCPKLKMANVARDAYGI